VMCPSGKEGLTYKKKTDEESDWVPPLWGGVRNNKKVEKGWRGGKKKTIIAGWLNRNEGRKLTQRLGIDKKVPFVSKRTGTQTWDRDILRVPNSHTRRDRVLRRFRVGSKEDASCGLVSKRRKSSAKGGRNWYRKD